MNSTRFSRFVTALDRAYYNRLTSVQRLCREVLTWKRLSHPNILPLLGVSVSKNPRHFRIISEWMPNGNVMEYINSNPEANRLRLVSPVVHSL
jgi:serine/threonine protein kinase